MMRAYMYMCLRKMNWRHLQIFLWSGLPQSEVIYDFGRNRSSLDLSSCNIYLRPDMVSRDRISAGQNQGTFLPAKRKTGMAYSPWRKRWKRESLKPRISRPFVKRGSSRRQSSSNHFVKFSRGKKINPAVQKTAGFFVVEHRGIEPLTSWLPVKRAPSCANVP